MTITMKKNNSDQTKGKPWTESDKNIKINIDSLAEKHTNDIFFLHFFAYNFCIFSFNC